jgi:hypothetical protein
MPLYTAISPEGFLSEKTKTKIAQEITRIHCNIRKSPDNSSELSSFRIRKAPDLLPGKKLRLFASIASYGPATWTKRKQKCSSNSGRCSKI